MAGVNAPGIRANRSGQQVVDKAHRGVRIYARLGCATQAQAEEYLALEIERIERQFSVTPLYARCWPTPIRTVLPSSAYGEYRERSSRRRAEIGVPRKKYCLEIATQWRKYRLRCVLEFNMMHVI